MVQYHGMIDTTDMSTLAQTLLPATFNLFLHLTVLTKRNGSFF